MIAPLPCTVRSGSRVSTLHSHNESLAATNLTPLHCPSTCLKLAAVLELDICVLKKSALTHMWGVASV